MSSTIHLRAVSSKPSATSTTPAETGAGPSLPQNPSAPSDAPAAQAPAEYSNGEKNLATRVGEAVFHHVLPPLIVISLLLGIWEILCSQPGSSLPSFTQVLSDTRELILNPFYNNGGNDVGLGWQILASLERVAYGYSLAVIGGIALGVLIGQFSWAMKGLDPIFQVLRTVPPLAWLPLSLAGFQDSHPSAIFVIFITAIWPIIINTSVGVRNIPEDYRNVARVIRLKGVRYFWKIMLPAAAPYIFSGLRIGVGLSWLAIVAAEMLVGGVGIGFFIWDAWNSSLISDIILALIYVGIVGFILDRMVAYLGRVVTRSTSAS